MTVWRRLYTLRLVAAFILIVSFAVHSMKATASESKSPSIDLNDWASVRALGLEKLQSDKFKAAEKYLNIARSLAEKKSTTSAEYLSTLRDLARLHEATGRYWQAYNEYSQVLSKLPQKSKEPASIDEAALYDDMGRMNYLLGDLPKARRQLEQSLLAFEKLSDQSLAKVSALKDLCQLHSEFGLFDRAANEAQQALELSQKQAGRNSLEVCDCLVSLARSAMFASHLELAECYIKQAMVIPVENSRTASLARAKCLDICAQIYLNEGRSAQAFALEQEAVAIRQKIYGLDHPLTGESLATLAIICIAQKDYASAKACLEKSLAIAQDRFGPESAHVAKILAIEGMCAQKQGSNDESKAIFNQSSEIVDKLSAEDNPLVQNVRDLCAPSSKPSLGFWQSAKVVSGYAVDPLSRCVNCLLTKGAIDRPADPNPPPNPYETASSVQSSSASESASTNVPSADAPSALPSIDPSSSNPSPRFSGNDSSSSHPSFDDVPFGNSPSGNSSSTTASNNPSFGKFSFGKFSFSGPSSGFFSKAALGSKMHQNLKFDPKALWLFGLIGIPTILFLTYSVLADSFQLLRSGFNRPERQRFKLFGKAKSSAQPRMPSKETKSDMPIVAPAAPTNTAGQNDSKPRSKQRLMSRFVDGNQVNKFWDINQ